MELSETQRIELHKRLIDLLQVIHTICEENKIKYTLIGGSLIGALRHKGFIPWDDDIDIGMTWNNYCKFKAIAANYRHEWIEFDVPGISYDYFQCFIKAYDARTTFWETQHDKKYAKGIFIDIMPFSNIGNNRKIAYANFKIHKFLQAFYRRKGYTFNTGRKREKLFQIGKLFLPSKHWMKLIDWHYLILNRFHGKYCSDMDGSPKGIVPASYFSEYVLCSFEDISVYRIARADEYLHDVFGNYMELPPIEERKPHHINYLNLEMPYKKFIKLHH